MQTGARTKKGTVGMIGGAISQYRMNGVLAPTSLYLSQCYIIYLIYKDDE